tara:strand:+ start:553 stop:996 length:444 start_codon:yes stop_codon:yes gene_type:complete
MSTIVTDTITGKSTATTITIGSTPVVSASANSMTIRGEGSNQTSIQQGLAKSWLQFNQTTPAITDSFNIGSVTDTGAGDFTPNYSNAMSGLTYAVPSAGGMLNTDASGRISETNPTNTSSYQVTTTNSAGTKADHTGNSCSTFGDLA